MQAIQATRLPSSGGNVPCRVRSLNPTRPPERSTRTNSAAADCLFGKVHSAHSQTIASNEPIGKWQPLGIPAIKGDGPAQASLAGVALRRLYISPTIVEADHLAPKSHRKRQRACPAAGGYVEDTVSRLQVQHPAEPLGQSGAARMQRVAQQQLYGVAVIDSRAALLDGCGRKPAWFDCALVFQLVHRTVAWSLKSNTTGC